MTWPGDYKSEGDFRRSINHKIKQTARRNGSPVVAVRRQYFTQRFLARIFTGDPAGWVLVGGASLITRLPGARHSEDIDLLQTAATSAQVDEAIADLCRRVQANRIDPFSFDVQGPKNTAAGLTAGAKLKVTVRLGANVEASFDLDIMVDRTTITPPEAIVPNRLIDDGMPAPPPFLLFPLPDLLADKLCTMYSTFTDARRPSTRYRDLVDVVLVVTSAPTDADLTLAAIRREELRRNVTLSPDLPSPGGAWEAGYRETARVSTLGAEHYGLNAALEVARGFIGPLLRGEAQGQQWNHETQQWTVGT